MADETKTVTYRIAGDADSLKDASTTAQKSLTEMQAKADAATATLEELTAVTKKHAEEERKASEARKKAQESMLGLKKGAADYERVLRDELGALAEVTKKTDAASGSNKKLHGILGDTSRMTGVMRERAGELGGVLGKVGMAAGLAAAPLAGLAIAGAGITKAISVASAYQQELEELGRTPVIDSTQQAALDSFNETMTEATYAAKEAVVIIGSGLATAFSGLAVVARDAANGVKVLANATSGGADADKLLADMADTSREKLHAKVVAMQELVDAQREVSAEDKINRQFAMQNQLIDEQIGNIRNNVDALLGRKLTAEEIEEKITQIEATRAVNEENRATAHRKRTEAEAAQAEAAAAKKQAAYEKNAAAAKAAADREAAAIKRVEDAQAALLAITEDAAADTLTAEDKLHEAWQKRNAAIQEAANVSKDYAKQTAADAANDERLERDLDALRRENAEAEWARRDATLQQAREAAAEAERLAEEEAERSDAARDKAIADAEAVRDARLSATASLLSALQGVAELVQAQHEARLAEIRGERAEALSALNEEREAILAKWESATDAQREAMKERLKAIDAEKQAEKKAGKDRANDEKKAIMRAFRASQGLAITQAIIAGAQSAMAMIPGIALAMGPLAAGAPGVAAGIAAIATGVQVATISAQKAPAFVDGGMVGEAFGNAPRITGNVASHRQIEADDDEAILNKRATRRLGKQGVDELNRGGSVGGGGTQVIIGAKPIVDFFVREMSGDGVLGAVLGNKSPGMSRVWGS